MYSETKDWTTKTVKKQYIKQRISGNSEPKNGWRLIENKHKPKKGEYNIVYTVVYRNIQYYIHKENTENSNKESTHVHVY